jgi:hypothetical protein
MCEKFGAAEEWRRSVSTDRVRNEVLHTVKQYTTHNTGNEVLQNTGARSCKHCCRENAISINIMTIFVALVIQD